MSNTQSGAASEAARQNSQLAYSLWDQSKGPLSEIFGMLKQNVAGGPNAVPDSVHRQFEQAFKQSNEGYDSAIKTNRELASMRAKTSGQPFSTGELDAAINQGTFALNQSREAAQRNLQFQEAQAGMGQYNQYLNLMGMGANTALGMGQGFGQAQMAGIGGMSQSGGWGGALQGAASGAATGTAVNAGWGTVIGGVLGGVAGYYS